MIRAVAFDAAGNSGADTVFVKVGQPWDMELQSPNPFCPDSIETAILLMLEVDCRVELTVQVSDVGTPVKTLVDGRTLAGPHMVVWDGKNDAGERVANGRYCCGLVVEFDGRYLMFPCIDPS